MAEKTSSKYFTETHNVPNPYPLDKNRELISEQKDVDGTLYKTFRLFSNDGEFIDVEYEIHHPEHPPHPIDANRKIVAEARGKDGYIRKLMMTNENGVIKEYWIDEKLPTSTPTAFHPKFKRNSEAEEEEVSRKKVKSGDVSDKNIVEMLEQVAKKAKERKYAPSDEFLLLLAKMKVEEVDSAAGRDIITLQHKELLSHAFKKLISNNILSAPVLLPDGKYYGFLDVLDIVNWTCNAVGETTLSREDLDIHTIQAFREAKVAQVMTYPISKKNPFHPFKVSSSLLSAVEELARGTHRVPVINDDDKLVNILTQSSVLQFIQKNIHLLGEKRHMKLEDIPLSNQYVLSVHEQETAIDAFRLIKTAGVGAVAVLNDEGKLVGNCSARDIKKISSNSRFLFRLFKPLTEYLGQFAILYAKKEETLETVINRIVENKLHRIYILDDEMQPQGLLSLSDILSELLRSD